MENMQVIDVAEALKRAMGDADFLKMMLEEFNRAIPDFLIRLENGFKKCDLEAIGNDAHQLKGAAANLGGKTLAAAALRLEQIGKSGNPEGFEEALAELQQAAEIFGRYLERIDWEGVSAQSSSRDRS